MYEEEGAELKRCGEISPFSSVESAMTFSFDAIVTLGNSNYDPRESGDAGDGKRSSLERRG